MCMWCWGIELKSPAFVKHCYSGLYSLISEVQGCLPSVYSLWVSLLRWLTLDFRQRSFLSSCPQYQVLSQGRKIYFLQWLQFHFHTISSYLNSWRQIPSRLVWVRLVSCFNWSRWQSRGITLAGYSGQCFSKARLGEDTVIIKAKLWRSYGRGNHGFEASLCYIGRFPPPPRRKSFA